MHKQEIRRKLKKGFREVTLHMPASLRRYMTRKKIEALSNHLMTLEDVKTCEQREAERDQIVMRYKKRYPQQAQRAQKWIDHVLATFTPFQGEGVDRDGVRANMEFAWFAYGFHPDEYVYFHLEDMITDYDRLHTFVSATERLCFRFSANDFAQHLFSDKAEVYKRFKKWYHRDCLIVDAKTGFQEFESFTNRNRVFIQKFVSGAMGQGVSKVAVSEIAGDLKGYFQRMKDQGKALLEEVIEQDDRFAVFNESSVNTVRIVTYWTRDGIVPAHGFFRTGRRGSIVDNGGSGGIFAKIDAKKGNVCAKGCDENGNLYAAHPDSGVEYVGFAFPEWEEALAICKEAARLVPEDRFLSFDMAYSKKGWVIVEINPSGEYLQQGCMDVGDKALIESVVSRMDLILPFAFRQYGA